MLDRGFAYCNELARLFCSLCAPSQGARAHALPVQQGPRHRTCGGRGVDRRSLGLRPVHQLPSRPLADGRRVNGELGKLDPEARGILLEFDFRTLLVDYDVGDDYYADLFDEFAIYEYEALEGSE